MNYPLISEYVEAIRFAEDNFSTLTNLRPVMENGRPFMSSGNFAVVFKMKDVVTGKLYAVKCFTREEEHRERSYRLISDELNGVDSPYLTSINYLEKELFVDTSNSTEAEFPILLMDWVEGQTMDAYIRENINDKWELERLCRNFCRMGAWLLEQPFAHGDLKPENIMVSAGAIPLLVDYDGMYVPAMKGEVARELGSPDYRHPLRTEKDFDEHIDDFPLASIALSVKAISLDPSLLTRYGASDRLLFSATDYADLSKCDALREITSLYSDPDLINIHSMFLLSYSQKSTLSVLSQLIMPKKAEKQIDESELLSTEVTDEDLAEAWEDEYGVLYSKDRKRLLKSKKRELTEYVVREGTKVICNYAFSWGDNLTYIKLPNSLTSLGNGAFFECCDLASITLPDSLVSIGDDTFCECHNLTSITLPKNLQKIKGNPFINCHAQISNHSPHFKIVNDLIIQGETVICVIGNPKSVTVPNYITHIGDSAFLGSRLSSINLPESLTSIGDYAFWNCESLLSIKLPDSLISIGDGALGSPNLDSVTLPRNLREIKGNPFYVMWFLPKISNDSPHFKIENNMLIQGERVITAINKYVETITIPNYITCIGKKAFYSCPYMTSINLPDSLNSIGDHAFWGCDSLTSVTLPNSVRSIGDYAFSNCKKLASIKLPNGLFSIGDSAFSDCENLVSIVLPDSLTAIGDSLFEDCKNLASIKLPFALSSIGDSVFEECYNMTSIELPKNLTHIGNNAFSACEKLAKIELPNDLTSIGDTAFSGCVSLISITLPNNLQEIKGNPFSRCNIHVSSKSPYFVIENDLLIHNKTVISVSGGPETITIPDYITHIRDSAFYECKNLTSIKFPDSLTSIGKSAFSYCKNLTSIKLPDSLTSIGDETFSGCENLTSIELPDNLTSIGNSAFLWCKNLTSIKLPDSLTSIGKSAFYECKNMTSIKLPDSLTSIGKSAFSYCKNLTSIKLPDSLTSIGDETFSGCENLTSIELPDSLTSIGNSAFSWCKNLTSIKLPDSLTSIGKSAFSRCENLTSIELPDCLTSIVDSAFWWCDNLEKIYIVCDPNADKTSVLEKFKRQLPKGLHSKIILIDHR